LVCEAEGRIIGGVHWLKISPEAEILDFAVKAEWRRRGCGTFLFGEFRRQAAAAGVQKIFLEVRESNDGALAFYKKVGFAITSRRPAYYRDPVEAALLLQIDLAG
jgi:ribosomal-protein-alanine N-acetyltransferase